MPVGKPDPVLNCSITSVYEDTVQINCAPGNSGGLEQKFNMEVVDVTSGGKILDHTGSPDASFYLRDLEIGRDYEIIIWASNSMGLSDPTVIQISNFHKIDTETDKRIDAFGTVLLNIFSMQHLNNILTIKFNCYLVSSSTFKHIDHIITL